MPSRFFSEKKAWLDCTGGLYGWSLIGPYKQHQWVIPNHRVEEYVTMLDQMRPFPKAELGPLAINVRIDFNLVGPEGTALPFQAASDYGFFVSPDSKAEELGASRLDVELSENSKARLFICLPFEEEGSALQRQVDFLNGASPFRLNPCMWKHWSKSKSGSSYKKRKVALESVSPQHQV